jgi:UDP:flavonoid glycosyltransferase YjiC (YdhE family)
MDLHRLLGVAPPGRTLAADSVDAEVWMPVLITTPSGLGHVLPMVPLARALPARDHDVLWAAAADSSSWVEDAGIPTVTAGRVQADRIPEFWRRNPEAHALPPERMPDVMFPKMTAAWPRR